MQISPIRHSNFNHDNSSDERPSLPSEIWQQIFSSIDPLTQPYLSLVCRSWYAIRVNQRAHEEVVAFHNTSLALFALLNESKYALLPLQTWSLQEDYAKLQSTYPLPSTSPYKDETEKGRQDLIRDFSMIERLEDLQEVFRRAQDWLADLVPFMTAISLCQIDGGIISLVRPRSKELSDLFNRVDLVLRLALLRDSTKAPWWNDMRRCLHQNLLRTRHFSTLKQKDHCHDPTCSVETLLIDVTNGKSTDALIDYLRLLEYSHTLAFVPDKERLQSYLLAGAEQIQSEFALQQQDHPSPTWLIETYRSYIHLLPHGKKRCMLQINFFLHQLQPRYRMISCPESSFAFELTSVPKEEKERLCAISAITLALQGRTMSIDYFLEKMEGRLKEQLEPFFDHLKRSNKSPSLSNDFPVIGPLITPSEKNIDLFFVSVLYESLASLGVLEIVRMIKEQMKEMFPFPFPEGMFQLIAKNKDVRHLAIQRIHQAPQHTLDQTYKYLLNKTRSLHLGSPATRHHLTCAILGQHPQLKFLPKEYYSIDVDLLLPN